MLKPVEHVGAVLSENYLLGGFRGSRVLDRGCDAGGYSKEQKCRRLNQRESEKYHRLAIT